VSFLLHNEFTTSRAESQEEFANLDTLQSFLNHRAYRDEYEYQVIPNLTESQKERWDDCSTQLWVRLDNTVSAVNSCKNRMCAICNWRNARKKYSITYQAMQKIEIENDFNYLFLTLTVKNTSAEKLKSTVDDMMEGINRMQSCKRWKKTVRGYVRNMEITYNPNTSEYHPHLHYIIAVNRDYYSNEDIYLSTYDWREMWERSLRLDYVSIVHIETIQKGENLAHAVAEVSKYAVKMAKLVDQDQPEAVKVLMRTLRRRRLIAYGGIYKDITKSLKNAEKRENCYTGEPEGIRFDYNAKRRVYCVSKDWIARGSEIK
jgi:hypothetical protein